MKGKQFTRSNNFYPRKKNRQVLKGIMVKFIPNIFHFVEPKSTLKLIERKINKQYHTRLSKSQEAEELTKAGEVEKAEKLLAYSHFYDGSFYDLLYFASQIHNGVAPNQTMWNLVNLLLCYDGLFYSLNKRLSKQQRKLVEDTALKIFRNTNSHYRHYIGELLALDAALNSDFHLIDTAVQIGNRKDAEYLVIDKRDAKTYLLEVVNVNLKDPNPKETRSKLVWKLNNKLKDGVDGSNFILFPVVWSEVVSNIELLSKGIQDWDVEKYGEYKDERIIEPFALYMIMTKAGMPRWEFTRISKKLSDFKVE